MLVGRRNSIISSTFAMVRRSQKVRRVRSPLTKKSSRPIRDKDISLLELKDIDAFNSDVEVLRIVTLSVEESEIVSIVGANCAGESTLINAKSGIKMQRGDPSYFRANPFSPSRPVKEYRWESSRSPKGGVSSPS
jgi:ABC-type molybdenum transport system ATPase subunit/photorepair protein PhrA